MSTLTKDRLIHTPPQKQDTTRQCLLLAYSSEETRQGSRLEVCEPSFIILVLGW